MKPLIRTANHTIQMKPPTFNATRKNFICLEKTSANLW